MVGTIPKNDNNKIPTRNLGRDERRGKKDMVASRENFKDSIIVFPKEAMKIL
jgi:hypothetical protein